MGGEANWAAPAFIGPVVAIDIETQRQRWSNEAAGASGSMIRKVYVLQILFIAVLGIVLGIIMGLHDRKHAPQLFKDPDTYNMREEERR